MNRFGMDLLLLSLRCLVLRQNCNNGRLDWASGDFNLAVSMDVHIDFAADAKIR